MNWCPALGTVLANEEVHRRRERARRPSGRAHAAAAMDAADHRLCRPAGKGPRRARLAREHQAAAAELDRPEHRGGGRFLHRHVRRRRRQAVAARSTRAGWSIASDGRLSAASRTSSVLRIYTTRPDTLFGATYMVIAPEHPFVERLTTPEQAEAVQAYCEQAARKSDLDRTDLAKDKTGVFTGSYAINPVNGEAIPIWVADYVLISYGTGAIMAVPAHDTRDFEFAKQFDLPISRGGRSGRVRPVRLREDLLAGRVALHRRRRGRSTPAPTTACPRPSSSSRSPPTWPTKGLGRAAVNYKLRDWLFSRQHFWGEPFPILHELDAARPAHRPDPRLAAGGPAAGPAGEDDVRRRARRARAAAGQGPGRLALRHARRQALQARDEHHAAMGRLVLVLSPLPRPEERQGPGRSARWKRPGCRSISTSAGRSTPCCTCSTPASGTRCSSTAAT